MKVQEKYLNYSLILNCYYILEYLRLLGSLQSLSIWLVQAEITSKSKFKPGYYRFNPTYCQRKPNTTPEIRRESDSVVLYLTSRITLLKLKKCEYIYLTNADASFPDKNLQFQGIF